MGSNGSRRHVRFAAVALAAGVCVSSQAAPPAHVMGHGEAADPTAAYVVVVPHVKVFGNVITSCNGVIVGRLADGSSREYGINVPADRPSVVRVEPGRYYFSRLDLGSYNFPLEENQSTFDAKAGQLNYPGDWNVSVDEHAHMRGAVKIGWAIRATLWEREEALDLGKLDVDAEFVGSMKPVHTHVDLPGGHDAAGG